MTNCFQIVVYVLFDPFLGCKECISGRTCQFLSIIVRYIFALIVFVALGETEVNNVDIVASRLGSANILISFSADLKSALRINVHGCHICNQFLSL